jgi:hypothetical protein
MDLRIILIDIRYPLQERYETFCVSFRNLLNHSVHGIYINNAAKVNTLPRTVREQLGLASFRRPLSGNGRVQLNTRLIRKKKSFVRLFILDFFLNPRQRHPVFLRLLCYISCVPVVGRTQRHEAN